MAKRTHYVVTVDVKRVELDDGMPDPGPSNYGRGAKVDPSRTITDVGHVVLKGRHLSDLTTAVTTTLQLQVELEDVVDPIQDPTPTPKITRS